MVQKLKEKKYSIWPRLLLEHSTISFIGCPSCPTVQYCSTGCQTGDKIHPLECKHFSTLETLGELAHITARLLLLVAEENVEPEELPFGQGSRGFWDLLSHASQIPDDDYWSVKIFEQVRCLQTEDNSLLSFSFQLSCQSRCFAAGSISQRSMADFSSTVLR